MNAQLLGSAVAVAGVAATLVGFRAFGPGRGPTDEAGRWHTKYGTWLKVVGPLLALGGVAVYFSGPGSGGSGDWQRHATADGACRIEFPGAPQRETSSAGDAMDTLEVALPERNAHFSLTFSDLSAEDAARPLSEVFSDLRSIYTAPRSSGPTAKLVKDEPREDRGFSGREYQFTVGDKLVSRIKVFVSGRRVYRAIAVTPPGGDAERAAQRFIDSFRFEVSKP